MGGRLLVLVFDSVYLLSCPFLGWNVKTVAGSRSTMTLLNHRILRRSKELFLKPGTSHVPC